MSPNSDGVELRWPGKYDADGARVMPPSWDPPASFRSIELHGATPRSNELALGENLRWLDARRAARGDDAEAAVDLAYMDPPFATGKRFNAVRPIGERDESVQLPAYDDTFSGGIGEYLSMLDSRVRLVHGLLAEHGSLYVHVDANVGPAVKLLLDEVFGPRGFQREIIWRIGWVSGFKTRARNWIRNHDCIYFYAKNPAKLRFNKQYLPHPPGYRRRSGAPAKSPGIAIDDVWNASEAARVLTGGESLDSIQIKSFSREKSGWATQKNESLLHRIISASSNPGDLILDPFSGSGTTAVVARRLGRRFAVCDRSPLATMLARQRLLADAGSEASGFAVAMDGEAPEARAGTTVAAAIDGDGAVRLVDYAADDWPKELDDRAWSDRVEAWGVGDARGHVVFEAHRTRADRSLELRAPDGTLTGVDAPRVFAWDVLGRRAQARVGPG